jgi:ABC-type oligopeptide transport system substrate-binding subunit
VQEKTAADYAQSLRDGNFDLALSAWPATDSDPAGYLAPLAHPGDPRNPGRYNEADFITRLRDADAQADPAQRLIMLTDTEAVLIQDQAILPIFFFTPLRPVGDGVAQWQANPHGFHPLHPPP